MKQIDWNVLKSHLINKSVRVTLVILLCAFTVFLTVFFIVYKTTGEQLKTIAVNDSRQGLLNEIDNVQTTIGDNWTSITSNVFTASIKEYLMDDGTLQSVPVIEARLILTQKLLDKFTRLNSLVQNVFVLYFHSAGECLCNRDFVTGNMRRDYMNGIISFDQMSYDDFIQNLISVSGNRVVHNRMLIGKLQYSYTNGFEADVGLIVCRCSDYRAVYPLYIIMPINLTNLQERLTDLHYASKDYLLLADNLGNVLYSSNPEHEIPKQISEAVWQDSQGHIYLREYFGFLNVYCYIMLDDNTIFSSFDNFNLVLWLLLIIVISLFIALTVAFFMRWNYPVIRFAEQLPGNGISPIEKIGLHIDELKNVNNQIREKLSHYELTAQYKLLTHLYCDPAISDKNLTELISITGIHDSTVLRCICIGCLNHQFNEDDAFAMIYQKAQKHFPELSAAVLFNQVFTMVVPVRQDESEWFGLQQEEMLAELNQDQIGYKYAVAVSNPYIGIRNVSTAYSEAMRGWTDALTWQNSSVIYYGVLEGGAKHYSVDYKQLEALYSFLCQGNTNNALQIFDGFVSCNFNKNSEQKLQQLFCQQFYYDIVGILARLSTQFDLTDILNHLFSEGMQLSIDEMIAILRRALLECSELIPRHSSKDDISSDICHYCEEHYQDPMMSLSSISEAFGFSESNLSKFFKAHTGVSYSVYIEDLRISKAVALLTESSKSVKDIASSVGYQNVTTFYNAFRRKYGCTPTQWLESHRKPS